MKEKKIPNRSEITAAKTKQDHMRALVPAPGGA